MLEAEDRLIKIRDAYQARALEFCKGDEKRFLIELVRALDETAFAFNMAPNGEELRRDDFRQLMLLGAASALRPFLEAVKHDVGGVPWGPTSEKLSEMADHHLHTCGTFAMIHPLIRLERYGLPCHSLPSWRH